LLLVDDEAGILEGLSAVLAFKGHRVRCAALAADARRLLAESRPDLLLTDWKLPDGDGLTLACEARAQSPALPVVLMTGFADDDLRDRFSSLAPGRLVEKPATVEQITAAVDALLPLPIATSSPPARDAIRAACDAARALGGADDACDRVALAAYAVSLGGNVVVHVAREGDLLRVEATWTADARYSATAGQWILDLLGGDLQSYRGGLRLTIPANGRPEANGDDLSSFRPRTREDLARRAHSAVEPFNAPPWLRLLCELAGERGLVPCRQPAGGRLPRDVAELWS
jgi:CheY-like chemotaxis protein